MSKIVILDPASPEFNRGSFCYLPYIIYAYHQQKGDEVFFEEDFTVARMDDLPTDADEYLVAVWSYPQLEAAQVLRRFLPKPPRFFGYTPLIVAEELFPVYPITDKMVRIGISTYHLYYKHFSTILLSDCDMHLNKYQGQVYPLFTSYGCPRGCAFCPSTVNCGRKRIAIEIEKVEEILGQMHDQDRRNIHFTDEDFFYNTGRAGIILAEAARLGGFQFIALGSVGKVFRFQNEYPGLLTKAGVKLIEVGLESADPVLGKKMGKEGMDAFVKLAEKKEVDIFWLTLTFFPGETITTLNATGEFLRQYGFKREELYGRIKTNGTEGGLGQFFQPYHGTVGYEGIEKKGRVLTPRPVRLLPSFIPYSFLHSKVNKVNGERIEEAVEWFDLYRVPRGLPLKTRHMVWDLIDEAMCKQAVTLAEAAIYYAICARLGVITS